MTYVGVDVSKSTLHIAHGGALAGEFKNTEHGRSKLLAYLERLDGPVRVVLEPTATYHQNLAVDIANSEFAEVMIANPRAVAHFGKALMQRGKTDALDCQLLASFGAAVEFVPWTAPSEHVSDLRTLMRRRQQLVVMKTSEKNRLKEMKAVGADPFVISDIEEMIALLKARIANLEVRAKAIVAKDDALKETMAMLKSFPGIGDVLAPVITAELVHLPADTSGRQLTAFAGLDPKPDQSGERHGRRHISRCGNKRLRTALYMAALTAVRHNPNVKAWKERLVGKGKKPKVAVVAVARRFLNVIAELRASKGRWDSERFYKLPVAS